MKTKYIFGASLPRSGTKLYTYALSANKKIMMASNPNIELFKFLKKENSEIFKKRKKLKNLKTNYMMEDYYGSYKKSDMLQHILRSNLNIKFKENIKEFRNKSYIRSKLEIKDLSLHMKKISGKTFKELFEDQIKIIKKRSKNDPQWLGFSESWVIEFFPAIARSFPDAKFLINIRDPRATIYANQNVRKKSKIAQILSYSRHFRKQIALANSYLKSKHLKNRIHIFTYESLVFYPKKTIKRICKFLDVRFDSKSTQYKNIYDFQNKENFKGASISLIPLSNFDKKRTYFWKQNINDNILKYIEFLCYHELKACGYKLFNNLETLLTKNKKKIKESFKKDLLRKVNWRSDSGNPKKEIRFEFSRHTKKKVTKTKDIKKYFINDDFYKIKLKNKKINTFHFLKDYNKALNEI